LSITTPPPWFDRIDRRITDTMAEHGLMLLRLALGIVFFWFGVLKFFPGASPAEALAGKTIETLTLGAIPESTALMILAVWESAIGIGLFAGRWMRAVLLLLFVQMLARSRHSSSSPQRPGRSSRSPRPSRGSTSSRTS
jgi:uncharacterized membrane protein YphA (DoxX/SURF4 family)